MPDESERNPDAGELPETESVTEEKAATKAPRPRWQRILAGTLAVLACILFPLSVLSIWLNNTVLDTDQYVETVAPLATNPTVQNAIADRVVTVLQDNVDLDQKIEDALPKKASFLAGPLSAGIENVAHAAALKVVQSDQFAKLWAEANRRAHAQVLAVVEGERSPLVERDNGQVVIRLGPVVDLVVRKLHELGLPMFDTSQVKRLNPGFVLIDSQELQQTQSLVSLFRKVVVILPILTILCIAGAIWLSPRRRRTALRIAIGITAAMGILLVALNLGRSAYLNALPETANQAAARAVYDQIVSFLRDSLRALFVLGIVVGIGIWLAGPSAAAVKIRTFSGDRVRGIGNEGTGPAALTEFVGRYRRALRIGVIALALIVVVAVDHPTPKLILVLAILVVLLLLLIEFLGRGATGAPPADRVDAAGA